MNSAHRLGGQGGQAGDMSPCVPLNWAEGDKGDKRGTCPTVSRPVGGQDRTKPLGLSYVPLAVRRRWGTKRKGKECLCGVVLEPMHERTARPRNATYAQGVAE